MFQYLIVCLSALLFVAYSDPLAQAKCRSLHATDADAAGTAYSNNKCMLICSIHGKLWPHNMSEGLTCPGLLGTKNICHNGQCVAPIPPVQLGYIDIELASAQLSNKAMVYADVCIQNASTTVTLPVANRTSCVTCTTKVVSPTTAPVWSAVCSGSHKYLWVNNSRVNFEVWEQSGTKNTFGGGASALVSQIVANGDNHKQINLPLAGGDNAGKITVRVTWTPK